MRGKSPLALRLIVVITRGDLEGVKKRVSAGESIDARDPQGGSTPRGVAALHGHVAIARYLIDQGADVSATNPDGNTPLHIAAFFCEFDLVEVLVAGGASLVTTNGNGERPIDVVLAPWSEPLAEFYGGLDAVFGLDLDLERIERDRPRMAAVLREAATRSDRGGGAKREDD